MKNLYKVVAVKKGCVAHMSFQEAKNEQEALELVQMQNNIKGAKWEVEQR